MSEILYESFPRSFRVRPIATLITGVIMLVGFVFAGLGDKLAPHLLAPLGNPVSGQTAQYIGVLVFALGVARLYLWYVPTRSNRLRITEDSVHWARGLFDKYVVEVSLDSVRRFQVHQGPLQRWLGIADVAVFTEGKQPVILVHGLPRPERIRALVPGRLAVAAA
jgi:uncharacterized membrane protein YdbT with pleckstrin-like domain